CSSWSQSEIVIPIVRNAQVVAVLDVDSKELNTFDALDAHFLSMLLNEIKF
ncbi:MAG: L-methionine (R)-S-oxide reductase, partial [Flavobacteriales bacterium]